MMELIDKTLNPLYIDKTLNPLFMLQLRIYTGLNVAYKTASILFRPQCVNHN